MGDLAAKNATVLVRGVEDRLPVWQYGVYGIQQLLVDGTILLIPLVITRTLHMPPGVARGVIQASILAAGLVTILQAEWGLRLPILQGPGIVYLALLPAVALANGVAAAFTAMVIAAAVFFVLGLPPIRLWSRLRPVLTLRQVYGCWMLLVVLAVAQAAIGQVVGQPKTPGFGSPANLLIGGIAILVAVVLGIASPRSIVRMAGILIAVVVGTAVAFGLGRVSAAPLGEAQWIGVPQWLPLGFAISGPAIGVMLIGFLLNVAESMAVYQVTGVDICNQPVSSDRMNRGILGVAAGSLVAGLFGGVGTVTYSQNMGVITMTGLGCRRIYTAAGAILIVLGFVPKFAAAVQAIPGPVAGALLILVIGLVGFHGAQALGSLPSTSLNRLTIACALGIGGAFFFLPTEYVVMLPPAARAFLSNGLVLGFLIPLVIYVIGGMWLHLDRRELVSGERGSSVSAEPAPPNLAPD